MGLSFVTREHLARSFVLQSLWVGALLILVLSLSACAGGPRALDPCDPCADAAPDPCADPCGPGGETLNDPPPEAKAGEAWCRVWVPPVNEVVTDTVMVRPERRRKMYVPPEYGVRPKLVCVKPARIDQKVKSGLWTTRKRDVLVCKERERWCRICCPPGPDGCAPAECWTKCKCPPVWRQDEEAVCIAPDRHCISYTPAQYRCIEERFIVKPGFCQEVCEPAEYEVRTRTVCKQPGRWIWQLNPDCDVPDCEPPPPEALPALEVRMQDSAEDGTEAGIFYPGDIVLYELTVLSDTASAAMPNLKLVITLPAELEFVSGEGDEGMTIAGEGAHAESSVFPLGIGTEVTVRIRARVLSAPPGNLVQTTVSIQMEDGTEVATETESTTLESRETK